MTRNGGNLWKAINVNDVIIQLACKDVCLYMHNLSVCQDKRELTICELHLTILVIINKCTVKI